MRPRVRRILLAYLAVLAVSHAVGALRSDRLELGPDERVARIRAPDEGALTEREAFVVYRDRVPPEVADSPVVLLVHGSPGEGSDFDGIVRGLGGMRTIAPDLPGFGKSRQALPDYSVDAHARALLELEDALGLERVHLVGFSLGGAVAIRMAGLAPERAASLTLLSATGVQELELFGSYEMNHLVHTFQLGMVQLARLLLPHFGALDRAFLGHAYARSFYDTDQRPLRADLESYARPMLVIHGRADFLVPVEAALEHHRIVPQSELVLLDGSHFLVFTQGERLAPILADFVRRAEDGLAATRERASDDRRALAARPFDPASVPSARGVALAILMLLIAAATFVSEDLTCIGVGLLVAEGRIGFVPGTLACVTGIFAGDVGLYLLGRSLGRAAVERAPLAWLVSSAALERAAAWFARHGGKAVLASRFTPGTRLATYVVAGVSRASFGAFCLYFLLAALAWTPLLVLFSAWAGTRARETFAVFERHALPALILAALGLFLVQRVLLRLLTARGRRRLLGAWRRIAQWEFWPPWVLYAPVALYVAWLALAHRSLRLMTAVNPAIPAGGFVGESKSAILDGLGASTGRVARHALVRASDPPDERVRRVRAFLREHALEPPFVLKPDVGQRGSGVSIVRSEAELERRVRELGVDSIAQEYVPGVEFGVFYARRPSEARGRVISITEKIRPVVVGDGRRTLEDLILFDRRAVCLWRTYFDLNAGRLADVPPAGERVVIAELGTHCRGAIFRDGDRVHTSELEQAIDELSRGFEGFFFGRYDLRAASPEALAEGRDFKVVELNGLTSESTHIYDPRHTLLDAWRTLFRQWRLAFEIARENRDRGARPATLRDLVRRFLRYRELQRFHATR